MTFQAVSCLMCHYNKRDESEYSKVAGFISGVAFYVCPQYQIYTLAFTKALEMSWKYAMSTMDPSNGLRTDMKRLQELPLLWMMRVVSLGVMYHTALFYPHFSPAFNHKAFNFCSNDA